MALFLVLSSIVLSLKKRHRAERQVRIRHADEGTIFAVRGDGHSRGGSNGRVFLIYGDDIVVIYLDSVYFVTGVICFVDVSNMKQARIRGSLLCRYILATSTTTVSEGVITRVLW